MASRQATLLAVTEDAAKADRVRVIPQTRALDVRLGVPGDLKGGIVNVRMRVSLEAPPYEVALDGKEVAKQTAALIAAQLSENYRQGLDAYGAALPPLSPATVARRERRRRQQDDASGARADRYKVRGGKNRGTTYSTADLMTPFHESGLASGNVSVTFKGRDSGDPTFLIALPMGGKGRGLVNDDGRGARGFALRHYGFERMMAIPPQLDGPIDQLLQGHLEDALQAGFSAGKQFAALAKRVDQFVEEGASGEVDE